MVMIAEVEGRAAISRGIAGELSEVFRMTV